MKRILRSIISLSALVTLWALVIVPNAQAGEDCSNASAQGSYGYAVQGTIIGLGPIAASGRFVADGNGRAQGAETTSLNGTIARRTLTATYTVAADCTGDVTVTYNDGSTIHAYFVIVAQGKELLYVGTDPMTAVTLVAKKQGE